MPGPASPFSKRMMIAALLTTVFGFAGVAVAATNAGWTTTKVAGDQKGQGYCAVSRKVDNTMVTVGKSQSGASSLALEFPKDSLDPSKTYRLSIKPGDADRIEVETKPVSGTTMVLNLDRVVDLTKSFDAQPTLQLRYEQQSIALGLSNWETASSDLGACLAALDDKAQPQKKSTAATTPKKPSAKIADESVIPTAPAGVTVPAPERDVPVIDGRVNELQAQIAQLRADNARLSSNKAAATELEEKIKTLEARNTELGSALAAAKAVPAPKPDASALNAMRTERDQIKADLEKLKAQRADTTALDTMRTERDALKSELEKIKSEQANTSAKLNAAIAENAKPKTDPAADKKIADLQVELDRLSTANADLRAQVTSLTGKPKGPDVAELQKRIEAMAAENVKLRTDLSAATTPETDMKVSVAAEQPLRQQIRQLRSENESLRARSDELFRQLDGKQKGSEGELLKASAKNWDLEQATRRYQEAEREVQRLSITMRDERTKCDAEKKEIEYMLFDPKLAKDGQIALLNSLEDELATLRAQKGLPPKSDAVVAQAPAAMISTPAKTGTTISTTPSLIDEVPTTPTVPLAVAEKTKPVTPAQTKAITMEPLAASGATAGQVTTGGASGISGLLRQAGIALSNAVTPAARNPFGAGTAYKWESDMLAGMAVEQKGIKSTAFDQTVSKQLKTLKTACKGDFAAQPAVSSNTATLHYAAYDAACIAGANSTSAALLFFQKDGTFNVISHEAAPDDMDKAMDARDRIITTLGGRAS